MPETIEPLAFTGYTCPQCPAWSTDIEVARAHCVCPVEGCGKSRRSAGGGYMTYCENHVKEIQDAREAKRVANMVTVDINDIKDDNMFYCDNIDEYSCDVDMLVDGCYYDDIAPEDIIIHPCKPARIPYIIDTISEVWERECCEEGHEFEISEATLALIAEVQRSLQAETPTLYIPIDEQRINVDAWMNADAPS